MKMSVMIMMTVLVSGVVCGTETVDHNCKRKSYVIREADYQISVKDEYAVVDFKLEGEVFDENSGSIFLLDIKSV